MTRVPMCVRHRALRGAFAIVTGFVIATLPAAAAAAESAEQPRVEEMIVTGSYIKGSAEDAALPVAVLSQQDLMDVGSPTIVEMTRNLNVSQGNDGETNQFDSRGAGSGVSTINLRGLGSARTLILVNGHRQVANETTGVDLSSIPTSALARVEVLKDGAAALYGSDAIAGVVNLITRSGFEGLEVSASNQFISDSDGDQNASFIYGWAGDDMDALFAFEYSRRSELRINEREWALRPFLESTQGGWSSIGMPGSIYRITPGTNGQLASQRSAPAVDPGCVELGGASAGGLCFFQYTEFDNLIEEQHTYKAFSEFNWDINDSHRLHVEALYAKMNMDDWKTSPGYPPQSFFGLDRIIRANHPGLVAMRQQFPTVAALGVAGQDVFNRSRYLGVNGFFGDPQTARRETETIRFGIGFQGSLFGDAIDYDISANFSSRDRYTTGTDMLVERMAFALDGLGGPNCNQVTGAPGVGGCQYFNPFSNAIEFSVPRSIRNPNFNPAVANSPEMIRWLVEELETTATNDLLTWDAVFSGSTGYALGGGDIGFAIGAQVRNESYKLDLSDIIDVGKIPCQFNNPASVTLGNVSATDFANCPVRTGPYAFASGTVEESTSRTIYGLFGELALPFSDTIDVQLAVRFEDYGGDVGSSIDPKLAVRWQAFEWLAFRGSASSTFRGPPQSILSGTNTALAFIAPTNAFKAVDLIGNPDMGPEQAVATNVGAILELGSLYASVDYWAFDFEDAIQTESFNQIVAAYIAQGCGGPTGAATTSCDALRTHVFPFRAAPADINRVDTRWLNGGKIKTSGVDWFLQYDFEDLLGGELALGTEGTYYIEFEVDEARDTNGALLAPPRDYVGFLNDGLSFRSMPPIKASVFARFVYGAHRLTYTARYIDEYQDNTTPATPALAEIDRNITHDLSYNVTLFDDRATFSVSVINLTDEDPPKASLDINYDPFTHSAFGRMIKVGLTYNFGQF